LERGEPVDGENRQLLLEVLADIRHIVEQPPAAASEEHHSMIDRLHDVTGRLEQSHPKLTSMAAQLVEALRGIFQ
jgi:hypothetical protein